MIQPGWDPDQFARGQLRWWDGAWSGYVANPTSARVWARTAFSLGIAAFVMTCFPIVGFLLAIAATATAIFAVRRNRDDNFGISALCINAVVLSLSVAALAWSIGAGLYGIVVSPWPA